MNHSSCGASTSLEQVKNKKAKEKRMKFQLYFPLLH
jgi:hypothetical protein